MLRMLTLFLERQKIPCGIVLSDQYYPDTGKPLTYPSPKPMLTQASLKSQMLAWGRGGRVVSQNPNWSSFSSQRSAIYIFRIFLNTPRCHGRVLNESWHFLGQWILENVEESSMTAKITREKKSKITWLCTFTKCYFFHYLTKMNLFFLLIFGSFCVRRFTLPVVCRKLCGPSYTLRDSCFVWPVQTTSN